jgi:uncharacterized protein (DUF1697 family)
MHIALLRAVNLGSHNKIGMPALCAWLTDLGFGQVRSLLQSGNLVFDAGAAGKKTGAQLEAQLEAEAEKRLGLRTDFFVRSAKEWQAIVEGNPFAQAAIDDPSHLVLVACKAAPTKAAAAALRAAIAAKGRETFQLDGRHGYFIYPDGIGNSKLTSALMEKHLGTRVTGRNWNTVLKLAAAAAG